ncbi:AMIN-like domain-containing (lipo)protein [Nakamurella lactea]|uniref:AMIN-like domain-containing (lipo)protein n=1 Tax=Nakamurella lactea TaxID=459515 RepID=UPI00055B5E49|nr:hypothetical protein [Nakamurella lactea]
MNHLSLARRVVGVIALAAVVAAVPVVAADAGVNGTAAAGCATVHWGSLPKTGSATTSEAVSNVRAGHHACYDRLVVDLGPAGVGRPGFDVRYVPAVRADGSGALVPVRGAADIQVVVRAPAYNVTTGRPTYRPANPRELVPVAGWPTLKQVAWAGSFEGTTTLAVGVRARLPMRAFVLDGPGLGHRLVVDIAHHW